MIYWDKFADDEPEELDEEDLDLIQDNLDLEPKVKGGRVYIEDDEAEPVDDRERIAGNLFDDVSFLFVERRWITYVCIERFRMREKTPDREPLRRVLLIAIVIGTAKTTDRANRISQVGRMLHFLK